MDTRQKIVAAEALRAAIHEGDWTVVPGYFDPLTAAQAQRIHQLRKPGHRLAAVVLEDEANLLPAEARAALIAALSDVDCVATGRLSEWIDLCNRDELQADRNRSDQFVTFVLARQAVAS